MTDQPARSLDSQCRIFSKLAGYFVMAIGASVLSGWLFDCAILKSFLPGAVATNPATAASFLLAGLALSLLNSPPAHSRAHLLAHWIGFLIGTLGLVKMGEQLGLFHFSIDQILFRSRLAGNVMSPNTAIAFVLIGFGLYFVNEQTRRGNRPSEGLAFFTMFLSLLALLGYAYDVRSLYALGANFPMALPTAITLEVASLGILCVHPDRGMMKLFTGAGAGGVIARRLLPVAIVLLCVVGWLHVEGERRALYNGEFGYALASSVNVLTMSLLIWWSARALQRMDVKRELAEEDLRRSEENLAVTLDSIGDAVLATDAAGRVTKLNSIAEKLTGWTQHEALGRPIAEVFHILHEETRQPAVIPVDNVLATGTIHGLANHTVIIARDGTERPIDDSAAPIHDKKGRILGVVLVFRDVTEEKKAQRVQRRLAAIVESSDAAIVSKSLDGIVSTWNHAAERLFGYTADEMIGEPITRIFPPERFHEEPAILARLKSGERVDNFETVRVAKGGRQLNVSATISPIKDEFGKVVGVSKILRDITERKQAEEDLRRSEENLAVTLDSIGDAVLATDAQRRITRMNPIAQKLTGWSQQEALGRIVDEVFCIIHEKTRQPVEIPVDVVLQTGVIHGLANHTVLIARDGTEYPIADSAAPIRDKYGDLRGVVLVFRDVSEERRAETEIINFNKRLEELVAQRTSEIRQALLTLDAIEEGAFIFDPDTLLHTYVNKGAMQQLGYTREELLRMTPIDFQADYPEHGYREMLLSMLHGQVQKRRFTSLHRHKDGHTFPVEISLQYIAPAGEQPRFIAIAHDITDRQKQEQLNYRSQRLEAIGRLASGVAHDVNNALAPIMLGVELIKMQYPNESKVVEMFEISAKRAADMVRQLLTFAKGAEGERIPLTPVRLIKELETIMKGSFPKNIELVINCDPKLPTVLGDVTQLHQVLLNLCVNARDAMPNGGTLTLEAGTQDVGVAHASSALDAKPGKYVTLSVRDTGVGIAPEIIDRIFDPFFTTKAPDKGTGLGLSTVLGIVKGHGGFLQVTSQPGQGAAFTAYLPANAAGSDLDHSFKKPPALRGAGETILLVDDEPGVREVGRAILQRLNFNPLIAIDGADAMIRAANHRTELNVIITDLHMPRMDGLAFIRSLRKMLPDIPVLVASGRMDDEAAEALKALGVTKWLHKPFTEAQLMEALAALLPPK